MQAPLRDRDPRRLGRYRLTARLGRGGMGTVFLGADDTGRQVAIKVINPELADDEAFHERFRREVTAARQVRRFCTAAVLDARLDGDPLYVVTEYVAGPTLDEAVREGGPLRGGDLEALAVNIATALSAIHGTGIVHRDLKPSNVLLSPTGPRVIDFGIARALDASDGPTRTGQFVGTPAYLAPELMRGEEITPAADVFSWGCVVAYAGTGRAPFGGGTLPETINRVMTAEPGLDGLDPALHDLVARSLAKDPADRPAVKQLIQALTGEAQPPATPPAPPAEAPPAEAPQAEAPSAEAPQAETPQAEAPPAETPSADEPQAQAPPGDKPPAEAPHDEAPHAAASPGAAAPPTMRLPEQGTTADTVPPTHPAAAGAAHPVAPPPPKARGTHRNHVLLGAAAAAIVGVAAVAGALNLTGDGGRPDRTTATAVADRGDDPPEVDDKVFDDKFSDEDSGWKTAASPIWDASYRDRKYAMRVLPATTRTIVDAPVHDLPESQLMEVKIESNRAGGEAGMFCRGQGGFAFLLGAGGNARIARLGGPGGKLDDLVTATATDLHDDGGDRMQAACVADGPNLRLGLWVNGKAVANAVAPAPRTGSGGPNTSGLLVVRPDGLSGQPEATFDNFALCSV